MTHKQTGFLVKERNVEELEEAIQQLHDNPELREKMGKEGRKMVLDRFDLKKQTRQLENIYQQVL